MSWDSISTWIKVRQQSAGSAGAGAGGGTSGRSGKRATKSRERRSPRGGSVKTSCSSLDYTGRLFRTGKAATSATLAGILDRLGSRAENGQARMEKLRKGRSYRCFFAASREKLRETAERLKVRHLHLITPSRPFKLAAAVTPMQCVSFLPGKQC